MKWFAGLAALWLAAGMAIAQEPTTVVPEGPPHPGDELLDREFGVSTDKFGLDRRVEMYQWLQVGADRYEKAWKAALVESAGFPPEYRNPDVIALEARRWWSEDATLDGKPLPPSVLKSIGRWQDFRPGFSRLPGNLSATFQPEGDGLISSENPLEPRIGDLRVSWRELVLPPLAGKVELIDGSWQLAQPRAAPARSPDSSRPQSLAAQTTTERDRTWWPWLLVGSVVVVVVGVWMRRRPNR